MILSGVHVITKTDTDGHSPRFLSVGKIMHLLLLSIVLTYLSLTWPFGFYNPSRGELHAYDYCVNLLLNELFMTESMIFPTDRNLGHFLISLLVHIILW
jgi:hypothetical protein